MVTDDDFFPEKMTNDGALSLGPVTEVSYGDNVIQTVTVTTAQGHIQAPRSGWVNP